MKKAWKWIIGILLGLVVLAILFCLPLLFRSGCPAFAGGYDTGFGWHMRGFGGMPLMRGFGFLPFGGLFGLGIFTLIVLGIIWLVRALRTPKLLSSLPPQAQVCPKCSQPVQAEWQHCAYCGKKL